MERSDRAVRAYADLRITGSTHKERRAACEDVVLIRDSADLSFFGIADGQGGQSHCIFGAETALHETVGALHATTPGLLARYRYTDDFKCRLMGRIRNRIQFLSQHSHVPESCYASTLVSLAVDSKTGEYVIAHLGDGCILGIRGNDEIVMLSPPDNGLTRQETWLTTSDQALRHLRIKYGSVFHYRRIVLLSDGAESICKGRNISVWAKNNLPHREPEGIFDYIRRSAPTDDASCVVIDLRP